MTRNKGVLYTVKGLAAVFNSPATGYVFYDIFKHTERPYWLIVFNTLCAVLLIDALLIWVLGVLEDSTKLPIKRFPAACSAIFLTAAIMGVGFVDEGFIGFAPRVGIFILVFNDLILWHTDRQEYNKTQNTREKVEQRIRDEEVVYSKEIKSQAQKDAILSCQVNYEEFYRNKILNQLGVMEQEEIIPEHSEPDLKVFTREVLENYVYKNNNGYYYVSPITGEEFYEKSTGGTFTEKGAKLSLVRHVKDYGYSVQ